MQQTEDVRELFFTVNKNITTGASRDVMHYKISRSPKSYCEHPVPERYCCDEFWVINVVLVGNYLDHFFTIDEMQNDVQNDNFTL